MRKKPYTLIEMLVVIAVTMVFFQASFKFFYDAFAVCRGVMSRSLSNQEISLVSLEFRDFVKKSGEWKIENGNLASEWMKVSESNGRLIFSEGTKKNEYSLPDASKVVFHLEKTEANVAYVVAEIQIMGRKKMRDKIRILAGYIRKEQNAEGPQ
jgi:hypothetical protein